MHLRRFQDSLTSSRLPRSPEPAVSPGAFLLCPVGPLFGMVGGWGPAQQMAYLLALEQARMVVRPSLPERDLLGVWN